jgi:hypothetical protein
MTRQPKRHGAAMPGPAAVTSESLRLSPSRLNRLGPTGSDRGRTLRPGPQAAGGGPAPSGRPGNPVPSESRFGGESDGKSPRPRAVSRFGRKTGIRAHWPQIGEIGDHSPILGSMWPWSPSETCNLASPHLLETRRKPHEPNSTPSKVKLALSHGPCRCPQ